MWSLILPLMPTFVLICEMSRLGDDRGASGYIQIRCGQYVCMYMHVASGAMGRAHCPGFTSPQIVDVIFSYRRVTSGLDNSDWAVAFGNQAAGSFPV